MRLHHPGLFLSLLLLGEGLAGKTVMKLVLDAAGTASATAAELPPLARAAAGVRKVDLDGDGRCDTREPWFTGFKAGNPQHLVNGFCWGLDGWLHGANGDSGGDIVSVKTGARIPLRGNDFSFDPRTGEFRLDTGVSPRTAGCFPRAPWSGG